MNIRPAEKIITAMETSDGAGILFLSAIPTGEPVVQQGPFVMNTSEEIEQAVRDYRDETLTTNGG